MFVLSVMKRKRVLRTESQHCQMSDLQLLALLSTTITLYLTPAAPGIAAGVAASKFHK